MAPMLSRATSIVVMACCTIQGSAGPPALPEVESVLTKATDKMQDFAAQASAMQARVAQKQKASRDALAAQKAKYEGKLAEQAQQNTDVSAANDGLRAQIASLEGGNTQLKKDTDKLRQDNKVMHDTLQAIQTKVNAADLFLADSLRVTDDSAAQELNVLQAPKPEPTLEHFLDVAKSDPIADSKSGSLSLAEVRGRMMGESLLQLSSTRAKKKGPSSDQEKPEDFVGMLSQSLADIASAEKEGVAQLEAHFRLVFEQGEKEHDQLLGVQKELNGTRASLETHQAELNTAKTHLKQTGDQLRQRLHGLRIFARKVDDAAGDALKSLKGSTPAAKPTSNVTLDAKVEAPPKPAPTLKRKGKAAKAAKVEKASLLEEASTSTVTSKLRTQEKPRKESLLSQFANTLAGFTS